MICRCVFSDIFVCLVFVVLCIVSVVVSVDVVVCIVFLVFDGCSC